MILPPGTIAAIECYLAASPAPWLLSSHLSQIFPRLTDRHIRAAAEASPNIISGQRGYFHASRATPDEISNCADWIQHQGTLMLQRSQRIRARARDLADQSPACRQAGH